MSGHLYWSPTLPAHAVLDEGDGGLLIVPIVPGGYAMRRPYVGSRAALKPWRTSEAQLLALLGDDAFVSTRDVAALATVTEAAVQQWRYRYPDSTPQPVTAAAAGVVAYYLRSDWLAWLAATKRLRADGTPIRQPSRWDAAVPTVGETDESPISGGKTDG